LRDKGWEGIKRRRLGPSERPAFSLLVRHLDGITLCSQHLSLSLLDPLQSLFFDSQFIWITLSLRLDEQDLVSHISPLPIAILMITKADFTESLAFVHAALDGLELLGREGIFTSNMASESSTRGGADILYLFQRFRVSSDGITLKLRSTQRSSFER
jgi:hypothetical protein